MYLRFHGRIRGVPRSDPSLSPGVEVGKNLILGWPHVAAHGKAFASLMEMRRVGFCRCGDSQPVAGALFSEHFAVFRFAPNHFAGAREYVLCAESRRSLREGVK